MSERLRADEGTLGAWRGVDKCELFFHFARLIQFPPGHCHGIVTINSVARWSCRCFNVASLGSGGLMESITRRFIVLLGMRAEAGSHNK
jgi:hypothetical protein